MQTQPKLSTETRLKFHHIFLNWFTGAEDSEIDMLEALMARTAGTEVRSMLTFIRGCLANLECKQQLPPRLVQALAEKNWPQGESSLRVVAVDGALT